MKNSFKIIANAASEFVGSRVFFVINVVAFAAWLAWGYFFGVSDTWQLVMTTAVSVITQFLVILIQASQNNDTRAIHAKLDEIIRVIPEADNNLRRIEK